ncbi:hypothetical protein IGI37_001096 [Enterococcus sp. AZ194]|uniref:MerR family transcriptional regulator n=1 Tax=Enterococcus sp. AZ194 TaxID=2774629 RepID=UPI003F221CB2
MYTIKQVSELIGVSKVTLRYYDKVGILKTKRSDNGYRMYDDLDIHILRNVLVFKQAGFSLEDIKILTKLYVLEDGADCNDLAKDVVSKNLKMMRSQIVFLKKVVTILEDVFPLFQTHELYKLNQKELEQTIMDLFEETKANNLEEKK